MDTSEIIVVVLLLLVGAGLVYYLLQHRTEPQWSIPGGRRPEVAGGLRTAVGQSARLRARLLHDESTGQREHHQALDGPERLRPHRSHAAGSRRVAAR